MIKEATVITRKTISEEQARHAMEHGEFPETVTEDGENVAILLTQGWCPQWLSMNVWLKSMEKKKQPEDLDITIYEFIYDKVPFFNDFRTFKENRFGNLEIPYIRYYADGECFATSNYVPSRTFVEFFQKQRTAQTAS